jgi:C-terminal processing protease CtpA/Prc
MQLLERRSILLFTVLLFSAATYSQTPQQIENAYAFARLYGYVKYFHPSDEAAAIDWNRFAIYGSDKVSKASNNKELQAALNELFLPLAPKLRIFSGNEKAVFKKDELIPPDMTGYKIIAWQHSGVGLGGRTPVYQSLRTNRPAPASPTANDYAPVNRRIDAVPLQGKDFVFQMKVKMLQGDGQGQLWVRVDKADKTMGFFDNMNDRPVKSRDWAVYEIKGQVDKDAAAIYVGVMLIGKGEVLFDDVSFKVKEGDTWKELYHESFSNSAHLAAPEGLNLSAMVHSSHSFVVKKEQEESYASIKSNALAGEARMHERLFERYPQPGEIIEKNIGGGLKIILPVALYGTATQTFPAGDSTALKTLKQKLAGITDFSGDSLAIRLGDLAISWNIFQHFYPYFDVVKVDWHAALKDAIREAYVNKYAYEFQKTLQHLTARLKDGHIGVYSAHQGQFIPPFTWEWIENELVITHVADSSIGLKRGDIVKKIDSRTSHDFFEEIYNTISAGTKGWLKYRAETESLKAGYGSRIKLNILRSDNTTADLAVTRTLGPRQFYEASPLKDSIKMLANGIAYLNLDKISMNGINEALPQLEKCSTIICDLRGYPNNNHMFITYLLKRKDTSTHWMQVPKTIYPDGENIAQWQYIGWGMTPAKTHLKAKIIFLIDGRAISYAESFMGFIEHYKLATIIGQPTAGANGNVNPFTLPGGYTISWTGMRVVKHDGRTHHGVGIQPDIFVEKTIKGVREGRDEFLEKALEVAKKSSQE